MDCVSHKKPFIVITKQEVYDPLAPEQCSFSLLNLSLRFYGQDIILDMVKMSNINAYVYTPWFAAPGEGVLDWNSKENYEKALQSYNAWQNRVDLKSIEIE